VHVFLREASSGTSTSAYFIGKNLAHVPYILVSPLFFGVFYVAFAAPRIHTMDLYYGLLLVVWSCTGAGYFLSMTMKSKAQLACTIYPLLCTMFAGLNPTLTDLKEQGGVGVWFAGLSYSRWSVNLFWLLQARQYDENTFPNVATTTANHGYDWHGMSFCSGVLFLIGLVARVLAFYQLRSLKRAHSEKVHHEADYEIKREGDK
jgi:hypothetical protein